MNHIITRIPPAWLSSNLLQTNGIGQTSVYVWVGPHGLHCHNLMFFYNKLLMFGLLAGCNLYTGRLFGCNCLLKKRSCEMVRTCIHSHILTAWIFFQPSCKPVLLNKYVLMFGLHHMGCIVTVWIAVGCFVVSACLKYSSEMVWTT